LWGPNLKKAVPVLTTKSLDARLPRRFSRAGLDGISDFQCFHSPFPKLDKMIRPKEGFPVLGLDLDGCITDAPEFFSAWSHSWPGKVIVITYRRDLQKAKNDLEACQIRYDEVVLVDHFAAKAKVIADQRVAIFVDDQPEILMHISADVHVLLFRNEGNYDFTDRRWMFSSETGKQVC